MQKRKMLQTSVKYKVSIYSLLKTTAIQAAGKSKLNRQVSAELTVQRDEMFNLR